MITRALYCSLILSILAATLAVAVAAQTAPFNERDDRYRLLGLKRAKQAYDIAKADYARFEELYNRDLIPRQELEQASARLADAEVNYQQSMLAVMFEDHYVTVTQAVKVQSDEQNRMVRLTVANASGGSAEYAQLLQNEDELFRALRPEIVNNVYVSILNDENAIVGIPYEAKIPELHFGEPVEIEFALLQDLDAVTVYIVYGDGSARTMKIFLQKDQSVDRVILESVQFSQEIDLGNRTRYGLSLELFSSTTNQFALQVLNLPDQISRTFRGAGGDARLSQVKFTESSRTKTADLEVTLPDRPTDEVQMDVPLPFFVVAVPRDRREEFQDRARDWTEEELVAAQVGYVRLELIPKGRGELRLRAPQLYAQALPDESVVIAFDIINEGSRRLDNIEVATDLPPGWQRDLSPEIVRSLDIGEERRLELTLIPPPGIATGKYEVRLRPSALSDNQPVLSEDKSITVDILAQANLLGTSLIVVLLLGLVSGIVFFGMRLARR